MHSLGGEDLLQELSKNNKTVVLQWIPGHCSIHRNEQADTLAQKGAFLPLTFPKPIAFHTVKNVMKKHKIKSIQTLGRKVYSHLGNKQCDRTKFRS